MRKKDGEWVIAHFITHVDNGFYDYVPIYQRHYRLARDWIGLFEFGLRTLDALHLAIALLEGFTMVTADDRLSKSAKSLGLDCAFLK